jgi:hypothetical protein
LHQLPRRVCHAEIPDSTTLPSRRSIYWGARLRAPPEGCHQVTSDGQKQDCCLQLASSPPSPASAAPVPGGDESFHHHQAPESDWPRPIICRKAGDEPRLPERVRRRSGSVRASLGPLAKAFARPAHSLSPTGFALPLHAGSQPVRRASPRQLPPCPSALLSPSSPTRPHASAASPSQQNKSQEKRSTDRLESLARTYTSSASSSSSSNIALSSSQPRQHRPFVLFSDLFRFAALSIPARSHILCRVSQRAPPSPPGA